MSNFGGLCAITKTTNMMFGKKLSLSNDLQIVSTYLWFEKYQKGTSKNKS